MIKLNIVEIFSGSGTVAKVFEEAGHNVFTIDIRKRKGVCEPSLRKDVLLLNREDIPFKEVHVVWAGVPCDVWSYASSGAFHWKDGKPNTAKCELHLKLLEKTFSLIEDLCPGYFFIENPRGRMRYHKSMIDFLIKNGGMTKVLTLSSYGFPTTKPTNIFTNALDWKPKPLAPFGRGAKVPGIFDNLTKSQRQKTPCALAEEILYYIEEKITRGIF